MEYRHQLADSRPGNCHYSVIRSRSETRLEDLQVSLGCAGPWNVITFSVQCCDTVGWATGRASGLKKLEVGLLMMMILTGTLHIL